MMSTKFLVSNGVVLRCSHVPRVAAAAFLVTHPGSLLRRPPSVTELLLSNNGDMTLEGCLTNFLLSLTKKSDKDKEESTSASRNMDAFEVQTTPLCDGILRGVIHRLLIEVCLSKGISFREVAPSWSKQERWGEAFVTNSLRLIQHADKNLVPRRWDSLDSKTWKETSWEEKLFKKEITKKADQDGCSIRGFLMNMNSLNGLWTQPVFLLLRSTPISLRLRLRLARKIFEGIVSMEDACLGEGQTEPALSEGSVERERASGTCNGEVLLEGSGNAEMVHSFFSLISSIPLLPFLLLDQKITYNLWSS